MRLSHNLSVDLWLDRTVCHAGLIVVRLLGGAAYWPYGVDELCRLAERTGAQLALLPGDADPDPALLARSTVSPADWRALHALLAAGGPENTDRALAAMMALAGGKPLPETQPAAFPEAGLWWPERGLVDAHGFASLLVRETPTLDPSPQGAGQPNPADGVPKDRDEPGALASLPFKGGAAFVPILFYRAVLDGAGTATVAALAASMREAGLAPVPVMVSSLKQQGSIRFVREVFGRFPPDLILNLTGFALGFGDPSDTDNPFAGIDAPIIQLVQSGRPEAQWTNDSQGLSPKDLAMHVVLPEMDGRIGGLIVGHKAQSVWHEATQCPLAAYAPDMDGIARAVALASSHVRLRRAPRQDRRVAIVLANYPIRDGRLANGVGYDAPQSTVEILKALARAGYGLGQRPPHPDLRSDLSPEGRGERVAGAERTAPLAGDCAKRAGDGALPATGNALIEALQSGPTNANPQRGTSLAVLALADYRRLFAALPEKIRREVTDRWGEPAEDPFCRTDGFHLPVLVFGNIAILLQPGRGYHLDEGASYHDPDLVPPHAYLAAYLWMRHVFAAHALIHNGKHGNLEWLPGKAVALDAASYPNALWGGLPHFYPFIVNDPGEGTQAKRRTGATIIDHLVPPLTRAETYGPLKDLEALLDEYYAASGMDRRRLAGLRKRILDFTRDTALDRDIGIADDSDDSLNRIDTFLCDLKQAQIRDGLHVFGQSPTGRLERDLIVALVRVPRGGEPGDASLIRALSDDLMLGFDPLGVDLGEKWQGPGLEIADNLGAATPTPDPSPQGGGEARSAKDDPTSGHGVRGRASLPLAGRDGGSQSGGAGLRTAGDVVDYLETLAAELVDGASCPPDWTATRAVLDTIEKSIRPRLAASGPNEIRSLIDGLDGKFVAPGPSGAPSRGRLDVLPTGRNFYSVDNRAVPTATAWELGKKSAENLVLRHFQETGTWLRSAALSVWGTASMRTGGDDIAQALALIGARPTWDPGSLRVSGYQIVPLAKLGRPRVDVTLRISGFFRDAFPQMIVLYDRAIRAIGALDEPEDQNPIAACMRMDALGLMAAGASEAAAFMKAGHRIFGSKPGAYGAGLQGPIDSGKWTEVAELANVFLDWGQYAYGAEAQGVPEREGFAARLKSIDAVLHNQDNREHDLLDSDDYYQFEGGLAVAATELGGHRPKIYHSDHSRPERPQTRTLEEEIARVMRSRVVNPKWIDGVKRHGYKGAFEIIATVDYMFAFAATTGAVKTHHFDLAFEAFVLDEKTRGFIEVNNAHGYRELLAKFAEAQARGLWTPKSNSVHALLGSLEEGRTR
ncbi:MAG: cobaltochelatase subunit CobN [Alphaproteobacteria bacterium]|nr:cobaltochelatase subunit CobN [Alphaproteobacteria bacterium]